MKSFDVHKYNRTTWVKQVNLPVFRKIILHDKRTEEIKHVSCYLDASATKSYENLAAEIMPVEYR